MHHRQFVGKNDTVIDIRRRMENNGIAEAYTDVFVNNNSSHQTTLREYLQYWFYRLTLRQRKALRAYFELSKRKKYNEYIIRFREDEEIQKQIVGTKYEWKK